jgi:hypothetical protein
MVANGAMGLIELQNTGGIRTGTLTANANYGGQITIDTQGTYSLTQRIYSLDIFL